MLKGASRGLWVLLLLGCGSTKSQSSDETPPKPPEELQDFTVFEELGEKCQAGVAQAPVEKYQSLSFFACLSGEADCQEPDWDGELVWDPVGTGDMLEYSLQASLDASGAVTRLLISKQYAKSDVVDGIPHEAVAYALPGGQPLAAFRNLGDRWELDSGSGVSSSSESSCALMPAVAEDGLVLIAAPTGRQELLWGVTSYENAHELPPLQPLDADPSILFGPFVASRQVAGIVEENGAVTRLNLEESTGITAQGDMQRLFLDGVLDSDLLLRDVDRTRYVTVTASEAEPVDVEGTWVRGDAKRLAWLVPTMAGHEVWMADRDGNPPADSARLVANLPDVVAITAVTIGDGVLAIQSGDGGLTFGLGTTLSLISLDDGTVLQRVREVDDDFLLLANTATQVWVGEGPLLDVEDQQFERLALLTAR
jgi:hypothetical protein